MWSKAAGALEDLGTFLPLWLMICGLDPGGRVLAGRPAKLMVSRTKLHP